MYGDSKVYMLVFTNGNEVLKVAKSSNFAFCPKKYEGARDL